MTTNSLSQAREGRTCLCLNLASVRERNGMTLKEITQSTKITFRFLQAIEAEDFADLPGGVYSTSYIRQYARAIGYSETELLDQYYAVSGVEPMSIIQTRQDSRATTRLGQAMVLFLGHLSAKPRAQHPA